jgi:phosphohistidine swiveling domain-containing protein
VGRAWFLDRSAAQVRPFEYAALVRSTAGLLPSVTNEFCGYEIMLRTRRHHTYLYHCLEHGHAGSPEARRQSTQRLARMQRRLDIEWRDAASQIEDRIRAWEAVAPARLSDVALASRIQEMIAEVTRCYLVHMRLVWPGMVALHSLEQAHDSWCRETNGVGVLQLVGLEAETFPLAALDHLWQLSRQIGSYSHGGLQRALDEWADRYALGDTFGMARADIAPVVSLVTAYSRLGDTCDPAAARATAQGRRHSLLRSSRSGSSDPRLRDDLCNAARGALVSETHARQLHIAPMRHLGAIIDEAGARLQSAALLRDPQDAYLLTPPELSRALIMHEPVVATVCSRKREMHRWRDWRPPSRLGSSQRRPPAFDDAFGAFLARLYETPDDGLLNGEGTWRGSAASGGQARGAARVVDVIADLASVQPGEVAVCRHAEPWLVLAIPLAAAVVTESGTSINHLALELRELGTPMVMGVPDLIAKLADGDWLEVDGDRGTIDRV